MKIEGWIDIEKPRQVVVKYFADPAYLGNYQDGFVKKESLRGQPGKEGAVSKMYYQQGKRSIELTETVLKNDLPDEFFAQYHHIHMDNTMRCVFTALDDSLTRYAYEVEYSRISWIMPRLMALLFPSMFRKQVEGWMKNFKNFVENAKSDT